MGPSSMDARPASLFTTRVDMLLASLVVNLAGLALPMLLLHLYDRIIPNAAFGTLAALLAGVAVAVVLEAVLRQARVALSVWEAAREEHTLSVAAISTVLRADPRHTPSPAVLASRLAAIGEWRAHRTGDLSHALADLPFVALYLLFLGWISPILALTALVCVTPGLLAASLLARRASVSIAQRVETEAQRHGLTQEVLTSIETLKALGAETAMQRRHDRLVASSSVAGRRTTSTAQLCGAFAAAGGQCVIAGVALVGALAVMQDRMSGGALAAAILLASRGTEPLVRLASSTPAMVRASEARRRVVELLSQAPRRHRGTETTTFQELTLLRVGLQRPDGTPLLRDISLSVGVGECVAIRGPGGSGKTRLLQLIAGVVEPDSGVVLINGRRRDLLDLDSLHRQTALLPQTPVLIPGRVIDNMTCFSPSIEPAARSLASELGLDAFFDRHPIGYRMQAGGSESQELPASIAERVACLRALVKQPRLILFDAANATQDRDGDERMFRLFARLKDHAAIVLVTDRPSWLVLADREYRIADGTLLPVSQPGLPIPS